MNEQDHKPITDAFGVAQNNTSLALCCIQVQLWVQSVTAAIRRDDEEGSLPTEIRKVIGDTATSFEKKFQSWWYLVNFSYDPITNTATAFVLSVHNASVYTVYPIIALGLDHNRTILCPLKHRVRAQKDNDKWQTVDVDACTTQGQ